MSVLVWIEGDKQLKMISSFRSEEHSRIVSHAHISLQSRAVAAFVFNNKEVVNLVDVKMADSLTDFTRVDLCMPKLLSIPVMGNQNTVIGVVQLNQEPNGTQFQEWDVKLLTLLVSLLKAPTHSLIYPSFKPYLLLDFILPS